jgi:hypothetical protein
VSVPSYPPNGDYTVNYDGTALPVFSFSNLGQAAANHIVFLPVITLNGANIVQSIDWSYQDLAGSAVPSPGFISEIQVRLGSETDTLLQRNGLSGGSTGIDVSGDGVDWTEVEFVDLQFVDSNGVTYNNLFSKGDIGGGGLTYDDWRQLWPSDPGGFLDNPDGDRNPNLLEYLFGTNPLEPPNPRSPGAPKPWRIEGNELVVRGIRSKDATDAAFQPETSNDFLNWNAASPVVDVLLTFPGPPDVELIERRYTLGDDDAFFVRLKVVVPTN